MEPVSRKVVYASYAAVNAQSSQVTLKRVDLAMKAFFRRRKDGRRSGFPRFKALDRYSGWGYKKHGQGFRVVAGDRHRHGKLRLTGIGIVQMRGRARTPGEVITCEIQHKIDRWYASFTLRCAPAREGGLEAIGLDWGVEIFATVAHESGAFSEVSNPRFLREVKDKLKAAQQDLSRKARGSHRRRAAKRVARALLFKITNRRRDFLHKTSSNIVRIADLIATEKLNVKNLVSSARGTIESPGRRVAQKAALNREILSTAPSAFFAMLRYKAAEAGVEYVEIPAHVVKPSQRCSNCWIVRKKALGERSHACPCGLTLSRDHNAARVNLRWAVAHTGREPTGCPAGNTLQATRNSIST